MRTGERQFLGRSLLLEPVATLGTVIAWRWSSVPGVPLSWGTGWGDGARRSGPRKKLLDW